MHTPDIPLPSRAELTDMLARQATIPQRVIDWAKDNRAQSEESHECQKMVQSARDMMEELYHTAHDWTDGKLGKKELLEMIPNFERQRSQINDLWNNTVAR